jgi:hypothetical protein
MLVQVTNPATGKHIATLPLMNGAETKAAIAAAASVLPQWSALTGKERGAYLRRWAAQGACAPAAGGWQRRLAAARPAAQGHPHLPAPPCITLHRSAYRAPPSVQAHRAQAPISGAHRPGPPTPAPAPAAAGGTSSSCITPTTSPPS